MKRVLNIETIQYIGEKVRLCGWVNSRRDHGQVVFIDLRDRSGLVQIVFTAADKKQWQEIRDEWVLEVIGTVEKRPAKMINPKIPTGKVEIEIEDIKILSQAKTLPFPIGSDGYDINEDLRLKYRYLDMRRPRLRQNLKIRQDLQNWIRDFLRQYDFIEVETPILTKATPEGARDFIVPSRLYPGQFYALPQSPQQYKQLLMVAGMERYFQFARCFRDEDLRKDRALEFTQLDIEMSFVTQEEILALTEELVIGVSEKVLKKKIQEKPFPRLTYEQAIKKYKKDNPDLRRNKKDTNLLAYCWIVDFPMFEKKQDGSIGACHHPFTAISDNDLENLSKRRNIFKIRAQQYDLVLNGYEVFGGSIRTTSPEILTQVFNVLGYKTKDIQERFSHLLEAFEYGVPPHGGIAASDRWVEVMLAEKSIREVIPFPTTGKGISAVMQAPSEVDPKQLKELSLKIIK